MHAFNIYHVIIKAIISTIIFFHLVSKVNSHDEKSAATNYCIKCGHQSIYHIEVAVLCSFGKTRKKTNGRRRGTPVFLAV